ncbi:MAG: Ig-like domain-containing protein [Halodesulfurarchaeum sp.]
MRLGDDGRAQAGQVGAILLFAIIVIFLAIYQATAVPGQNREIEFQRYLEGSDDVVDLRNALLAAAGSNTQRGVSVQTGARYPARIIFVNPPPASGTLRTTEPASITLSNVASASEYQNVGAYLSSEGNTLSFGTRDVVFDPAYNQLDVAGIRLSEGLVYRNASSPIPLSSQPIIQGNRLTLLTVTGSLQASGQEVAVTVEPVSAYTRTITVTNESDGPVTLTLPTRISASRWEEILSEQIANGNVTGVEPGPTPNTVTVTLEPGTNYELRIARLELRRQGDTGAEPAPDPRYMVSTVARAQTTNANGRVRLTVEVRDRYNNPVTGAAVHLEAGGGKGTFEYESGENISDTPSVTVRTDEDGRATVWYNATGGEFYIGTNTVRAYLGETANANLPVEKKVTWSITNTVLPPGQGGGGVQDGEQAGRTLVVLQSVQGLSGEELSLTINNTTPINVNMTGYRLDYATLFQGSKFVDGPDAIQQVTISNGLGTFRRPTPAGSVAVEQEEPYFFHSDPIPLESGLNGATITFDQLPNLGGNDFLLVQFSFYYEGGVTTTFTLHIPGGGRPNANLQPLQPDRNPSPTRDGPAAVSRPR